MSTSVLWLDPYVLPLIRGKRILDLGCGFGHWGDLIRSHHFLIEGMENETRELIGVDLFPGNVELCRSKGCYTEVILSDAVEYLRQQPAGSFDTVLAMDIVEHMAKDVGYELMAEIDRVASKSAMVSTPGFNNIRGGLDGDTGFNPYEAHHCEWTVKDLKSLGYEVKGIRHRFDWQIDTTRGLHFVFRRLPVLDDLLHALTYRMPSLAYTLLAWKHK